MVVLIVDCGLLSVAPPNTPGYITTRVTPPSSSAQNAVTPAAVSYDLTTPATSRVPSGHIEGEPSDCAATFILGTN